MLYLNESDAPVQVGEMTVEPGEYVRLEETRSAPAELTRLEEFEESKLPAGARVWQEFREYL